MKVVIVFTEDFANKKKGDEFRCDSIIASQLIRRSKVAKLKTNKKQNVKK